MHHAATNFYSTARTLPYLNCGLNGSLCLVELKYNHYNYISYYNVIFVFYLFFYFFYFLCTVLSNETIIM